MSQHSDIILDASKFKAEAISQKTIALNDNLIKIGKAGPQWYEVGAAEYRRMRVNGETAFPKPTILESGKVSSLPSRDKGRDIPTRIFTPEEGKSKGVFLHIHGGGWVLHSEEGQDPLLKAIADSANVTVVSVGYRLAPEHPFPAGPEDCYDAGEWLIDNAKDKYGVPLLFMGGESAGGHLAALTCFHLLQCRPSFSFLGLVLNFGAYDMAGFLPQSHTFSKPLVLTYEMMFHFREAFLPNTTEADRRDPSISPLFANFSKMKKLPPALFTVGTEDCLLDDTVLMSAKWMMSGAEAVVKVYPGAPHAFILFPPKVSEAAEEAYGDIKEFLVGKLGSA